MLSSALRVAGVARDGKSLIDCVQFELGGAHTGLVCASS